MTTACRCDAGTPRPDDFEIYLLHTASEYVLATRDTAFLDSPARPYNSSAAGEGAGGDGDGDDANSTVLELLMRAV
jgi:hypothetical protein